MKKRFISLLLVFCMIFSLLPAQIFALSEGTTTSDSGSSNPFTDVKEADWYYDAVQYAWQNDIFSGTSDVTFMPDGTMTRGMFVTVLGRMAGVETAGYGGTSSFSDVPDDMYYAPYVAWAAKHGITSGVGNGQFSPNNLISRQQMATFLVRYFEKFDVEYDTGANITTIPKDIDNVEPYAREAVLKLWKAGLLNGDGLNFNPEGNATRAQAATLCMRTDETVEVWYKEPGVPSERETPVEEQKPSSGSGGGDGNLTTYYEVNFNASAGVTGATIPATKTYASGTKISALPTPYKQNTVFLGWYYDNELKEAAENSDTVTRNMDLYAKFAEDAISVQELQTPNYMTAVDVETNLTFQVKAASADAVRSALTIKNVTAGNETVTYTLSGGSSPFTISAVYAEGQTYKAELDEYSDAILVYNGEQPDSIRIFNFITKMDDVLNLGLSGSIKYIPKSSVSGMTGTAFDGLFNLSVASGTLSSGETAGSGTFTYSGGDIAVGDTVAIYVGTRPDLRHLDTDEDVNGDISYVTITAVNDSTYSYTSADSEDVLFTPDVLPVSSTADTDGDTGNHSISVTSSVLDFSGDQYTEMGLDSQTTVDAGDFILFYAGELGDASRNMGYARISSVSAEGDNYTISYSDATEADVLGAMNIYTTREEEVDLSGTEIAQIETDMENQALQSGFVGEAAQYLTALALETDGFKNLSGDMDLKSYSITMADNTPLTKGEMMLMSGSRSEITKQEISATVAAGKVLQHFDGSTGIRAELAMIFTVEVSPVSGSDNKIEITLQAVFEQEVLLKVNVSGGAEWKMKWIFPYINDYRLNANFDVGTFTGIGITATAKTVGADDEDEYDWNPATGSKSEEKIINIGKQITDLMDAKETFLGEKLIDENGEEIEWTGTNGGGLAEKYAAMIENADDSWIELFRKEIFSTEGSVDPFHVLVYGISADFVVSANMYVTMGMTFEYGNAKRYNFSLMLFQKKTTNETIDLEEAHYQFDFYVMGTLGVRAGIELEVAVGLFSLKLDSIGITAEVGAYAQLWGYFYYHYLWENGTNGAPDTRESNSSGAMLIEIGIYLEITFKAQLFSSEKLTYQPTLLDKRWPLLTIGEAENVYDFNYNDADTPAFDIKTVKTFALPTNLFEMQYMDLQSGEVYGGEDADDDYPAKNYDDNTESHFIIEFSNDAFTYNPAENTVTVLPGVGSIEESGTMSIIWKNGTLAFTSRPISRTIKINWTDPASGLYIFIDSTGGSQIEMIFAGAGAPIPQPAEPTKQGYEFDGWYTDITYTTPFTFPSTMPNNDPSQRGVSVCAKWKPALNTYKVEHYFQELNGQYSLDSSKNQILKDKKTDEMTAAKELSINGFTGKTISQETIAANGSTTIKVYYDRTKYTLTFSYGAFSGEENPNITYTYKYGAEIYAPRLALGGYLFEGWNTTIAATMPAEDIVYTARWEADPNTPYRVDHYLQNPVGEGYTYFTMESKSGTTDSPLTTGSFAAQSIDGMTYHHATVDGITVTTTFIKAKGNLVIKLHYIRNTANVSFDSLGGSSVPGLSGQRYGARIAKPADPQKDGYTFAGWYKDVACTDGNAFDFTLDKMGISNLTLYAKWTAGSYTVSFDANGGTGTTQAQSFIYGIAQGLTPEAFTRTGYTFNGWNNQANGSGTITYADRQSVINLTTGGTFKLFAQWLINSYTIKFYANNGTDATINQQFNYNESKALTANGFSKTGYTFNGWNTTSNSSGISYGNGQSVSNLTTENGAIIDLYARWTANTYAVAFVGNGNTGGGMSNQSFIYDEPTKALTANSYSKTGYTFNGWNTMGDGTGIPYVGGQSVSNLAVGNIYTLYAQWTKATYTVTLDKKDGTGGSSNVIVTYGNTIPTITVPTKIGFKFNGYYGGENGAGTLYYNENGTSSYTWDKEANATLYANWTVASFIVVFNATGGTGTPSNKIVTYGSTYAYPDATLPTPTRTGYIFDGWFTESTGGTKVESSAIVSINNTQTLYAQWTANTYTVTFDATGGIGTPLNKIVTYGSTYAYPDVTLPIPTRIGYTFDGWFTASTGGTKVENSTIVSINNAQTLYAQWNANTYTVQFNGNGHSSGIMSDQNFSYGAPKALTDNNFNKTGYTFAGWATSAEGAVLYSNSQSVSNLTSVNEAIVELYAKWTAGEGTNYTVRHLLQNVDTDGYTEFSSQTLSGMTEGLTAAVANTYTGFTPQTFVQATITGGGDTVVNVYYDRNVHLAIWNTDGGSVINDVSYRYDKTITTPAVPTKTGYTFTGWTWSGSGGPVTTVPTTLKMGDENITFTANWEAIQYTVIFDSYGGSNVTTQMVGYNGKVTEPSIPTKAGATFLGWYNYTTLYNFDWIVTGNLSLSAVWKINTYTVTFNTLGGVTTIDPQTVAYGSKATMPAVTPYKEGNNFGGWYSNEACTTAYSFDTAVLGAITLYTKWIPLTFTVTFNTDGGNPTPSPQIVDYNGTATEPIPPTKTGYTFIAWNWLGSGYNFNLPTVVNKTLIADWRKNSYTVIYNGTENTFGYMGQQGFTYDNPQALTEIGFTKTGYTFAGWNTQINGSGTSYSNREVVSIPTAVDNAKVNLYAQWRPITYKVQFADQNDATGTMVAQNFTYDVAQNLSSNKFVKNGYGFGYWLQVGVTTYADCDEVSKLSAVEGTVITLYANWKVNQYTLTFMSDSNTTYRTITQNYDTDVTWPPAPTRPGYSFGVWNSVLGTTVPAYMPAQDVTFLAQWDVTQYPIYYYGLLGGTVPGGTTGFYTIETPNFILPYPSREGYDFVGWSETETSVPIKEVLIPNGSSEVLHYYANWTPKS